MSNKCQHYNFEDMCKARNDIIYDDDNRIYNEETKEYEVKIDGTMCSMTMVRKMWGGDSNHEWKCEDCGKSGGDMYSDVDDIDPTSRVSQQPHGKSTLYCNQCQAYVCPTSFGGDDQVCPYHQRSYQSEEGTVMMYEEFDQDGEAY